MFDFKRENTCGQAFDFYEFINCSSIIEGCIETLFDIFGEKYSNYLHKNVFVISNKTNKCDLDFFKFIRSASTMHSTETTRHMGITKSKFEVFPYVIWVQENYKSLFLNRPQNCDLEMLAWKSMTNSNFKRYYLCSYEFEKFVSNMINDIEILVLKVEKILEEEKGKICCKKIKKEKDFIEYSDYLLYLRKRILNKNKTIEENDGGLLLASFIYNATYVSKEFKLYIKKRVKDIVNKMSTDITSIEFDEIFSDISLSRIISGFNEGHYVAEKFHDYLFNETIFEIKNKKFNSYKNIDFTNHSNDYSNEDWAVVLLMKFKDVLFEKNELDGIDTYAELYSLTLDKIYIKSMG